MAGWWISTSSAGRSETSSGRRSRPSSSFPISPAQAGPDEAARLAAESDDQARFVESRLRVYVGREDVQRELVAYTLGNEPKPCLVTGPSGSGKSAALAKFVSKARKDLPGVTLISHFIGASPVRPPCATCSNGCAASYTTNC